MTARPAALPEDPHPALTERAAATRAWLDLFGPSALEPHGDLLTAVTHETQRRRWTVRLDIGSVISGDIELAPDEHMTSRGYTDVTAALTQIVLDFVRMEQDAGMPLYPRRGPPLYFGGPLAPANDHSGQLGHAAGIQAMFARLAKGYRFEPQDETLPPDGGTLTYRKEAYTLDLTARRIQDRRGFVYSGLLTRHFRHGGTLTHALPVLEDNKYSQQFENRHWRDSAVLFVGDVAQAAHYVSLPDENGWSYGRVTQLHAGKGTGFISNVRAEHIYFHQDQLTNTTWRPEVGSRVRFHCANVVQSQVHRVTAYRAPEVTQVDSRVALHEFA